eukprot:TRINITY_DN573927_c0_g2_i1.p1 TRINITY_DN573927_c0_g2~~TRINITY_DN573927_c0_g2_i1.p1  ORF type:complete len:2750 (-),score=319.36 TRINITY_DN573927_c0_g2_i1:5689-13938(-)
MMKSVLLNFLCLLMLVTVTQAQTYHPDEVAQLREFLDAPSAIEGKNNGQVLCTSYKSEDPSTWDFNLIWTNTNPMRLEKINVQSLHDAKGFLNLSNFSALREFIFTNSSNNYRYRGNLNEIDFSNCNSLEIINCSYNLLTKINLTGCTSLKSIVCANTQLKALGSKHLSFDAYINANIIIGNKIGNETENQYSILNPIDLSEEFKDGQTFSWIENGIEITEGISHVGGIFKFDLKHENKIIYCKIGESGNFKTLPVKLIYPKIPASEKFYDIDQQNGLEYIFTEIGKNYNYWAKTVDGKSQKVLDIPFSENIYGIINMNNDATPDFNIEGAIYRSQSSSSYEKVSVPSRSSDPNLDGRPDFGNLALGSYYQNNSSQKFEKKEVSILTLEEFLANQDLSAWSGTGDFESSGPKRNYTITTGVPGMSDHMLVTPGGTSGQKVTFTLPASIVEEDFNNDGLPDVMGDNGVLYNLGNDTYVEAPFPGKLVAANDLTGDGISDFVLYNETENKVVLMKFVEGDGYVEEVLFQNQAMDQKIKVADFDGDNDLDIFLPFSAVSRVIQKDLSQNNYIKAEYNGVGAFYAFCQNDGAGNFTPVEGAFMGKYFAFDDFVDIDGDGLLEIILRDYNVQIGIDEDVDVAYLKWNNSTFELHEEYLFKQKVNSLWRSEDGKNLHIYINGLNSIKLNLADIDGDGRYEIWDNRTRIGEEGQIDFGMINSAPQKMNSPTVNYQKGSNLLEIFWEEGQDNNSSSCELTYALRIGTASGSGDMVFAHANADGSRRNLFPGNMGTKLLKKYDISTWPNGTYYVSVQAVDPQFKGGAWSEEVSFEKETFYADFDILPNYLEGIPNDYTTLEAITFKDSVMINFKGEIGDNITLEWEFDDPIFVNGEGKGPYKLKYDKEGVKTITMSVLSNGTKLYTRKKHLSVSPLTIEERTSLTLNDGTDINSPSSSADFDSDGDLDFVLDGLYTNNGDGTCSKLGKIFNLDYNSHGGFWCDYDLNGEIDILGSYYVDTDDRTWSDHYVYHLEVLKNNGNSNFTLEKDQLGTYLFGSEWILDINNDGFLDAYGKLDINDKSYSPEYGWSISQVNYEDRTFKSLNYAPYAGLQFIDWNHDGLMDIWTTSKKPQGSNIPVNSGLTIFLNKSGIPSVETPIHFPVPINESNNILAINDFDNDQDWDVVMRRNERSVILWLNNGTNSFADSTSIVLPEGCNSNSFRIGDYDNNGYLDFLLPCGDKTVLLAMNKDLKPTNYLIPLPIKGVDDYNDSYFYNLGYDLSGDGIPDFGSYPSANYMKTLTLKTNTAPQSPTGVMAVQSDTTLKISWSHGVDAETPAAQMRYNLSVKKAGASGAHSFIISPGNNLNSNAAVQPGKIYIRDNKYIIPITRFEAGEYEIQLQSIDLWNACSEFSPVVTVQVEAEPVFDCPDEVCFGSVADIKYKGTITNNITWEFNEGEIISGSGVGPYEILWKTEGIKTITATVDGKSYKKSIKVLKELNAGFTIANTIVAGSPEPFILDGQMSLATICNWSSLSSSVGVNDQSNNEGTLTIFEEGTHDVSLTVEENGCMSEAVTQTLTVLPALPRPSAKLISMDATGKNSIHWDASVWPEYITQVHIYKEGIVTNEFVEIASLDKEVGTFVDEQSDPNIYSDRYYLVLEDKYGHFSENGAIHQTVHLTINKGVNTAWNLLWNSYMGIDIASYRIYRGSSAENMHLIAELAGSKRSFTDLTPDASENLYQLEIVAKSTSEPTPVQSEVAIQPMRNAKTLYSVPFVSSTPSEIELSGRTNIVATENALSPILAEQVTIKHLEDEKLLDKTQKEMHLYTSILPTSASVKDVSWEIVSGGEYASLSSSGLLQHANNGSGSVVVRATTLDGSNVSAELEVPVSGVTYELQVKSNNTDWGTASGAGSYEKGTDVLLSATLSNSEAYYFVNWTNEAGSELSQELSFTHTVVEDQVITANFAEKLFIGCDVNPEGTGSVSGSGYYLPGEEVEVTATANQGYQFTAWKDNVGNVVSTDNPLIFTASEKKSLFANFEPIYTISLGLNLEGAGTFSGGGEFVKDSQTTIEAVPNEGYEFKAWHADNGNGQYFLSETNPYTLTVSENLYVEAQFAEINQIIASVNPAESGTVLNTGIYESGAVVTISAIANQGFYFSHWTDEGGNTVATEQDLLVTVYGRMKYTANFSSFINIAPLVQPLDAGIVNGGGSYKSGEEIQLSASPNEGFAFKNWTNQSGDILGEELNLTYVVTPEEQVTANFIPCYKVEINASEGGSASFNSNQEEIYPEGMLINCIATPTDGYKFVNWTNDSDKVVSAEIEYQFTLTHDVKLNANFIQVFNVSVVSQDETMGSVSVSGNFDQNNQCENGTSVQLQATSNDNYRFTGWRDINNDIILATENPYEFTVQNNVNIQGEFGLTARLELSESQIDLQKTPINQVKDFKFIITNIGIDPLDITSCILPSNMQLSANIERTVQAGESVELNLQYFANAVGVFDEEILIHTDDQIGKYSIGVHAEIFNPFSEQNLSIEGISPSCYQLSDGEIVITNLGDEVRVVLLETSEEITIAKDATASFENLSADIYSLMVYSGEADRKYEVVLSEQDQVQANVKVSGSNVYVSISGGVAPYEVELGGQIYVTETGELNLTGIESGDYNISVTDQNLCSAPSVIAFEIKDIKLAPNPARYNETYLYLPNISYGLDVRVEIYSLGGAKVLDQNYINSDNQIRIDLKTLANGMYLVRISCQDNESYIQKALKLQVTK